MKLEVIFAAVVLWCLDEVICTNNENLTSLEVSETVPTANESVKVLSRRRRYIVFPKGASLQIILEELVHLPTQFAVVLGPTLQVAWPLPSEPLEHMPRVKSRFGMTVGLAWQLPDDPEIYSDFKKKHKIYKRNVLKKMEGFMRPGGSNGKQCVLRALCESGQRTPSKKGFVTEILHKIFSMNDDDEDVEDSHDDKIYRKAHRSFNQNCEALYPDCGFSIFSAVQ